MDKDNMEQDQLISVYRAANPQQAAILCSLLENAGIEATNDGDTLQSGAGELPIGWSTAPQIRVLKQDEKLARQLIEDFENGNIDTSSEELDEYLEEAGFDWPQCPKCDELRYAYCPECEFVGIDFESTALVELSNDNSAKHAPQLLTCPICAKKSKPVFIDHCRFCSHQFDEGVAIQPGEFNLPDSSGSLNLPVIVVGLLLLGLIAAGVLYFAFLV